MSEKTISTTIDKDLGEDPISTFKLLAETRLQRSQTISDLRYEVSVQIAAELRSVNELIDYFNSHQGIAIPIKGTSIYTSEKIDGRWVRTVGEAPIAPNVYIIGKIKLFGIWVLEISEPTNANVRFALPIEDIEFATTEEILDYQAGIELNITKPKAI